MLGDLRDEFLEITAEAQEILREVMEEITGPQILAQVKETWITAPDELKERYKQEKPEEYQALMEMLKGE